MYVITTDTSYKHYTFMIGVFSEWLYLFGIAFSTGKHKNVEVTTLLLFNSRDFAHYW